MNNLFDNSPESKAKASFLMQTDRDDYAQVLIEQNTNRTIYVYGDIVWGFEFDCYAEVGELFKPYFQDWYEKNKHRIGTFDADGKYYEYLMDA